jgi:ubiquinone/menaquinone biosynthesis C-methylase UbiE
MKDVAVNSQEWLRRWDRQQEVYIPERETTYRAMFDALAHFLNLGADDSPFLALDLACGTGSISQRLLARFPGARAVAVDIDPVLMKLGRDVLDNYDGRLTWVEADLRLSDWVDRLPERGFDAMLSSTAIHWFSPERTRALYRELAQIVNANAVFLNFDAVSSADARIQRYFEQWLDARTARISAEPGREDWNVWFSAIGQDPAFASLIDERRRRFDMIESPDIDERGLTMAEHADALRAAGFTAVDTIWQDHRSRVVIALFGGQS